jgi:hypothetical protein
MGVLILASILVIIAIAALMFTRGGATEPVTSVGPPAAPSLRANLSENTERALSVLGLAVERREASATWIASNADNRVLVRAFENGPVRGPDVQAAIDFARSEGVNKTILIATNGFTDEAILAARDTPTELLDSVDLERLLASRR